LTTSTVHNSSDHSGSAYELACRLIETELGGRRLIADPADPAELDGRSAVCACQPHLVDVDNTVEV
jgi:hypothetical protein